MTGATEFRRRKYKNPPIVEAVARFNFQTPITWDIRTPGLLYECLKAVYPAPPEIRNQVKAGLTPNSSEGKPLSANFAISSGPAEVFFFGDSREKFIMVSPISISAHGLAPYEGWEELEHRLYDAYALISTVLPDGDKISQCSIRYINRIELPGSEIKFEEYLTISFTIPPVFPPLMTAFFDRVEVKYPDNEGRLAFTWASVESKEGHTAFILDLDLLTTLPKPMTLAEAMAELDKLKARETEAFEGLILDRLREVFGEYKD